MKQWYALYVYLYSYEFVIWPDCFVGHSCPGRSCTESGPLSLTCSITTTLGILLMIAPSIYVFISILFRWSVPGRCVCPHSVGTRWNPCFRVCAPLTLASSFTRKQKSNRGWPGSPLEPSEGGIWTDAWVSLHYWMVIWVARYFNCPLYYTVYGMCHSKDTPRPYGRILF